MKPKEYYNNMRSVRGCLDWLKSVGLVMRGMGGRESEIILPGARSETDLSLYYDGDTDDLDLINCMNRLRRWKESPEKEPDES